MPEGEIIVEGAMPEKGDVKEKKEPKLGMPELIRSLNVDTFTDAVMHNIKPKSRDRMKKYGEIIGISDYRPHCQRKTRLNLVYEETGDLALAAELANHRSTETTREFYCRKQTKAEVMNKINALRSKNSNVTDEENK